MSSFLRMAAGVGMACGIAFGIHSYLRGGKWAAGYWWSKRDRKLGLGS